MLETIPDFEIYCSIDAGTPETFRKIRVLDAFDLVVENIKALANDPNRTEHQRIGVTYNLNTLNIHEVEQMVSVWQGVPIYRISFVPTHIAGGSADTEDIVVSKDNYHLFVEAKEKIKETADRLGVKYDFDVEIDCGLEREMKVQMKLHQIKL